MDYKACHRDWNRCSRFIHKYSIQLERRKKCCVFTILQWNGIELIHSDDELSSARLIVRTETSHRLAGDIWQPCSRIRDGRATPYYILGLVTTDFIS